ncbi:zinc ribbon domain-containing protein [Sphingomonas caseinilyticus]|uniref:zinc ribbon domain-containing protein n=1 Tax=Sphingomonas caseinilyticus TaxID=2908205 RepID=UPI00344F81CF
MRTGKSGRYRYYACSRRATRGETACPGKSIRMEKLDSIVMDALEQRIIHPGRLPKLLEAFLEQSDVSESRRREELAALRTEKPIAPEPSTVSISWSSRGLHHQPIGTSPSGLPYIEGASRRLLRILKRWNGS